MSLLFMGFVFIISFLAILYSDDYVFGDLNIIRFIMLVLMFVISIMKSMRKENETCGVAFMRCYFMRCYFSKAT
jgi:hypothetical protein